MYKKVWCTCEVDVLLITPVVLFLPFRCRPRRWILSSPMAELSAVLLDCLKTSQEQQEDTDEKHLPFGVYLQT